MDITSTIIGLAITILFIGFFTGYRIAFVNANRLSIELKKKQGRYSGIILSRFMENTSMFIACLMVGYTIVLVIYGLLFSELIKASLWNPLYDHLKIRSDYIRLIVDTFFSAVIVLVLGEFLPKAVFRAKNDTMLSAFAPVAGFFQNILQFITGVFINISQWILKYIFNVQIKNSNEAFNHFDLERFFQQTREQDEENPELNRELFENALGLPMIKVRQCLLPRTEIEAVDIDTTIDHAVQHFTSTKLSKLIVYEDNIDNIVGYIHQLDLFKKPATIKDILLPIPAIPESMSAVDLIAKFSKERKSIAWVVDEFGGTSGIVTMEDVLEEIFGEIKDEYDVEEFEDKRLSDTEFLFRGRLELDYLNEKYDLEFPKNESETLSGYIINYHETIPKPKDKIIIDDYQFDILNVTDTRIEMVKMKILK